MTPERIAEVEDALGVTFPKAYRDLLAAYPFPAGSLADECLVLNDAEALISLNRASRDALSQTPAERPFLIGSDCGEEVYFVDLASPACPVYAFELETWQTRPLAESLSAWTEDVRRDLAAIARDEAAEQERQARRPGIRFW
jgi:hypothetical protein